MKYTIDNNVITFDAIYPIENIKFKSDVKAIQWAIHLDILNEDRVSIEGSTVSFDRLHIRFLVLEEDNDILDIKLFEGYKVEEQPRINDVFRRNDGWAGADGVFSHKSGEQMHWYFSDTLLGPVDPNTRRRESIIMVNNTVGISSVDTPFDIDFKVKKDSDGSYTSYYIPLQKNEYYWLQDGCVAGDYLYISVIRVKNDEEKGFKVLGAEMLRVPLVNNQLEYQKYERYENKSYFHDNELTYTFGAAILDDRERTGYYYMFGYDNMKRRNLVMLRLTDFFDNDTYEFYTTSGWSKEAKNFKTIGEDTSHEMRMIYDDNKYIITYTRGCASPDIMFAYTENLEEGFKQYTQIYQTNEQVVNDVMTVYNAKVHVFPNDPHYYVSYNVNALDIEALYDADIYYPRWLKLTKVSDLNGQK